MNLKSRGEPAVLLVSNMIAENKINNLDMISNAQPKRDYYRTAALIAAYWQENLDVLSDELISHFHGMSDEQMISTLMKDRKYYSRFGGYSITRRAEEVPNAPGWKWLDWLGDFNDDTFPWVYHLGLGGYTFMDLQTSKHGFTYQMLGGLAQPRRFGKTWMIGLHIMALRAIFREMGGLYPRISGKNN